MINNKKSLFFEKKKSNIRKICKKITKFFKKYIPKKILGYYYQFIHYLIILLGAILILFCNNISYLLIIILLVSLDGIANFICHDCPLTILEKKYLKKSLCQNKKKFFKNMKILYKCNHVYETQVELIVNVWALLACKIMILLILKTFSLNYILYITTN